MIAVQGFWLLISAVNVFYWQQVTAHVGLEKHHQQQQQHSLRGAAIITPDQDMFFQRSSIDEDDEILNPRRRLLQQTALFSIGIMFFLFCVLGYCMCQNYQNMVELELRDQRQQQQQQDMAQRHQQQQQQQNMAQRSSDRPAVINSAVTKQPRVLVTAAATKSSPFARFGLAFTGTDYAEISRILPDSIFHQSDLAPGMKIVSINNIVIGSTRLACEVLHASYGPVTILAHSAGYFGPTEDYVTITVAKQRPDQSLSIVYKQEAGDSIIRLGGIAETSSSLEHNNCSNLVGMEIVAINNVSVQSVMQARQLTRYAFPLVTLLARRSAAVATAVVLAEPPEATAIVSSEPLVVVVAEAPMATVLVDDVNNYSSGVVSI